MSVLHFLWFIWDDLFLKCNHEKKEIRWQLCKWRKKKECFSYRSLHKRVFGYEGTKQNAIKSAIEQHVQKCQDCVNERGTGSNLSQYRTSDETVAKRKRQREDKDRNTKRQEDRQIGTQRHATTPRPHIFARTTRKRGEAVAKERVLTLKIGKIRKQRIYGQIFGAGFSLGA